MSIRSPKILPTHELNPRRRRIAALKRLPAWLLPGKNQPLAAPTPP